MNFGRCAYASMTHGFARFHAIAKASAPDDIRALKLKKGPEIDCLAKCRGMTLSNKFKTKDVGGCQHRKSCKNRYTSDYLIVGKEAVIATLCASF